MFPLIPIAISLATKFAPDLISKLMGDKAGEVAEKVIGIASSITGKADPQEAHDMIMANPTLQLDFEKSSMNFQLELYKEDTKRLESTNATMREEAKSTNQWQAAWRPFNGFLFGISLFCDYFVSQIIEMIIRAIVTPKIVPIGQAIVPFVYNWQHIPDGVYMLWAAVLGVSAGSRGFEKVAKTKSENGGSNLSAIDLVKLFGKGAVGK